MFLVKGFLQDGRRSRVKERLVGEEVLVTGGGSSGKVVRRGLSLDGSRRPPGTLLPIGWCHFSDLQLLQVFEKFSSAQCEFLRAGNGGRDRHGLHSACHILNEFGGGVIATVVTDGQYKTKNKKNNAENNVPRKTTIWISAIVSFFY